jgi:hypothetical protein
MVDLWSPTFSDIRQTFRLQRVILGLQSQDVTVPKSRNRAAMSALAHRVAAQSAWTYEATGLETVVGITDLSTPAVFIPALNRLEAIVSDGEDDLGALQQGLRRSPHGEVWVLAPLSLMGDVRSALRGRVDRIVPWWVADQAVKFGAPQIP